MDKELSLRLGQASVIRECDITIPLEFEVYDIGNGKSSAIPTLWIKFGCLEGRIYEQLFVTPTFRASRFSIYD
jgi:hypothetical protein